MHLRRVAHRARRDEERDHQRQRIERKADQVDEAEAPHGGDQARDRRAQRSLPVAEVEIEQNPRDRRRGGEDPVDLVRVLVHPAVELGLAGHDDLGVVVDHRLDDAIGDFVEQLLVIDDPLDEARADQRGAVVDRHQHAVEVLRAVDDAPQVLHVGLGLGAAHHHRLHFHQPAGGYADRAVGTVCERLDLVVVDAVDLVELLGHRPDLVERLDVEDVALANAQHDQHGVGAAEGLGELAVDLDERMRGRQQLVEAADEPELERVVPEEGSHHCDEGDRHHPPADQRATHRQQAIFGPVLRHDPLPFSDISRSMRLFTASRPGICGSSARSRSTASSASPYRPLCS